MHKIYRDSRLSPKQKQMNAVLDEAYKAIDFDAMSDKEKFDVDDYFTFLRELILKYDEKDRMSSLNFSHQIQILQVDIISRLPRQSHAKKVIATFLNVLLGICTLGLCHLARKAVTGHARFKFFGEPKVPALLKQTQHCLSSLRDECTITATAAVSINR